MKIFLLTICLLFSVTSSSPAERNVQESVDFFEPSLIPNAFNRVVQGIGSTISTATNPLASLSHVHKRSPQDNSFGGIGSAGQTAASGLGQTVSQIGQTGGGTSGAGQGIIPNYFNRVVHGLGSILGSVRQPPSSSPSSRRRRRSAQLGNFGGIAGGLGQLATGLSQTAEQVGQLGGSGLLGGQGGLIPSYVNQFTQGLLGPVRNPTASSERRRRSAELGNFGGIGGGLGQLVPGLGQTAGQIGQLGGTGLLGGQGGLIPSYVNRFTQGLLGPVRNPAASSQRRKRSPQLGFGGLGGLGGMGGMGGMSQMGGMGGMNAMSNMGGGGMGAGGFGESTTYHHSSTGGGMNAMGGMAGSSLGSMGGMGGMSSMGGMGGIGGLGMGGMGGLPLMPGIGK